MQVKIYETALEASQEALNHYRDALNSGAKVFGLATGSTPEKLYAEIVASDLDFSDKISINLDEYYGLDGEHPQSYHYFMNDHLFQHKPFKESHLPNGAAENVEEEIQRYNQLIADNPIDLQLLGIGVNGHIAFNEPGTERDTLTHLVDLTPSTIEANQRFFTSKEEVPTQALSMGIASIMSAKEILLLAFGEAKAPTIKAMIEGPVTADVPASFLQEHPNVTVILDKAAASLLS